MKSIIKLLLFAAAFTPLIITWSAIFPFILGKTLFFRSVVEIALILFLIYLILNFIRPIGPIRLIGLIGHIKNPLFVSILLFFISLTVSTALAENSYRAFWGDLERGEGLWTMLHGLAFLIMTLAVFEKKDWLRFFKISLIVGFVIIFYAFLQYFNVQKFPFALAPQERPISYIGNPAFLATHMFFVIIFSAIVFFETISKTYQLTNLSTYKLKFWRYFSLFIIVLSSFTIFISGTRGAILGLGAGFFFLLIYFSARKSLNPEGKSLNLEIFKFLNIRKLSVVLLILILIFSAVFWLTRDAAIWQKIPGLNRLAKTAFFDVNDPSTQFRIITWKLSWNAFKEKPLFGWGPENYIVAYEKYYDPVYAVYGESWLDRAHNKIFDVLVMQGVFGLSVYLGIFGAIFYSLFKLKESVAPFLTSGLIGYFVQNFFVFDQVISDFTFFAVLGFLLFLISFEHNQSLPALPRREAPFYFIAPVFIFIAVFIAGLVYSLYFYNLVPYIQARLFKASPGVSKDVNVVADYLKKSMHPYNFAQLNIRGGGIDTIYMDQFFYRIGYVDNPRFRPLGDLLIAGMDEVVKREPYDIRVLIREVEMLNGYTRVMDEKEAAPLFKKAEELMREAVKRAPNRQEVYYHLAFNLAGQKRYDEAIEAAKYAIFLNPKVSRAHFHLALVSTIAGKNREALDALAEVDKLDPDLKTLMQGDKDATLLIYNANGRLDKVAELITESLNRGENRAFDRKYYEAALRYYALKTDAQNFVQVAAYLKQFDDLKDDMEVLIDLAEKGMWDIMLSL